MTTTDLVQCEHVARVFGSGPSAVVAVHGTSCTVATQDRIALVGSSGSGKSTMLHLMAGLEQPTTGRISWPALNGDQDHRTSIGVVFQGPSLVPALNVIENVEIPVMLSGAPDVRVRALEALDSLGIAGLADQLPETLSGGQAQRVAVARVLAQRPRLILADEPTGQLDRATGQHLMDVLLTSADQLEAALVVCTHDPAIAARLNTHWPMHEGRLLNAATTTREAAPVTTSLNDRDRTW